jgi:DNA topoisomerase-3
VVIATDADHEGEVIARELLEYCRYSGAVRRLWLSARMRPV